MRVDLRVKHDIEARKAAIGLFELGHGYKSAAIALSLPVEAVRRWQEIYRAFGSEVLLRMDGKQGRYTYEQKAAGGSGDGRNKVASYVNALPVFKRGRTFYIEVINPVHYASYVEFGHRTPGGKGWVAGQYFLTLAESQLESRAPAIIEKELEKKLKEVFKV